MGSIGPHELHVEVLIKCHFSAAVTLLPHLPQALFYSNNI